MNKEQVLTKLRSINYPGFSRDIVSFGMVKDIEINDESIKLELNITSQNEEKKQQVIKNVKKELGEYFTSVEIVLGNKTNQTPPANFLKRLAIQQAY